MDPLLYSWSLILHFYKLITWIFQSFSRQINCLVCWVFKQLILNSRLIRTLEQPVFSWSSYQPEFLCGSCYHSVWSWKSPLCMSTLWETSLTSNTEQIADIEKPGGSHNTVQWNLSKESKYLPWYNYKAHFVFYSSTFKI